MEWCDTTGRARASTLVLPHGEVCTPVFMPVGTKAAIKAMTSQLLHVSATAA